MPTIRMRGNYGNNVILAEEKRPPKLLNFSEIFYKPLPFHDKKYSDFFFPLTQPNPPLHVLKLEKTSFTVNLREKIK